MRRVLAIAGIVASVFSLTAAALFFFGGMMPPTAPARTEYAAEVAAGRQPAVEARFTIPIPGCVCHSDDPVLQVQHSNLRIRECGGCHKRS